MPGTRKRKPVRAATLADVGRAAGVSAMAVSAVLNNARTSSRIAPETRARILEAAARLRYRPNAAARALAGRRMRTIGVAAVFYGGEPNQYFTGVLSGVLEAAARHDQNTTVFTLHDWEKESARLPAFCDGRIDGLILIAPTFGRDAVGLLPEHTPFVTVHANSPLPGVVDLESDEETGACNMVRHLISLGHRRILHLAGDRGMRGAERRIAGYRRALESAGIPCDEDLVVEAGFSFSAGQSAMRAWLERFEGQPLPQAVFCANDGIAVACLEVFAAAGIRVPDDVSVAGFDDTIAARTTVPQLTTIRQPLRLMGGRAVETLLELVRHHHGHDDPEHEDAIVFPTELVIRNSVGPAPSIPRLTPRLTSEEA